MTSQKRILRLEEVKQHTHPKSAWIIINNQVFDVSKLLLKHPGGDQVLMERAGSDATEDFEDKGHSIDARELKKTMHVGDLHPDDRITYTEKPGSELPETPIKSSSSRSEWWIAMGVALLVALAYNFLIAPGK